MKIFTSYEMKHVKKFVFLMAVALLSGCANKPVQEPMPVDVNPSDALKFARSIDLRLISDYEKGKYIVFNEMQGGYLRPLEQPAVVGQRGKVASSNNSVGAIGNVAAGFITNTALIPLAGVLTARSLGPFDDGNVIIAVWNNKGDKENRDYFKMISREEILLSNWTSGEEYCKDETNLQLFPRNREGVILPSPPIVVTGSVRTMRGQPCLYVLASNPENNDNFVRLSLKLGNEWVLFTPGTPTNEPLVYNNGVKYRFIKNN
ncbi:hypothetical protein [Brenneria roseae]|nr:hypothetical protein [Brenneria roseae]